MLVAVTPLLHNFPDMTIQNKTVVSTVFITIAVKTISHAPYSNVTFITQFFYMIYRSVNLQT